MCAWGAGERGPFPLNTLAIKEVWKLWMKRETTNCRRRIRYPIDRESGKERESRDDTIDLSLMTKRDLNCGGM